MASIGKATVKIVDDGRFKAAVRDHMADAWDEGHQVHAGCRECWDDGHGDQINPYRDSE